MGWLTNAAKAVLGDEQGRKVARGLREGSEAAVQGYLGGGDDPQALAAPPPAPAQNDWVTPAVVVVVGVVAIKLGSELLMKRR